MGASFADQSIVELVRWSLSIAVPAVSGLIGVGIGAWLTSRRDTRQRRHAFLEKQLSLFYSPMLGVRNEIQTKSALRVRIQDEASAAWTQLCAESEHLDAQARQRITNERGPEFTRVIEYDNQRLHKDLLPAYTKLIDLFREHYWLAEPVTRGFYGEVLEFVDIWNRWVEKALPVEVLKRLDHSEAKLTGFYAHLQAEHDAIRAKLKAGDA